MKKTILAGFGMVSFVLMLMFVVCFMIMSVFGAGYIVDVASLIHVASLMGVALIPVSTGILFVMIALIEYGAS